MGGNIFIVQGDITQLAADAIAYSTSTALDTSGLLFSSFKKHLPEFVKRYCAEARQHRPCHVGDTLWIDLPHQGKPRGVVVVAATGRTSVPPETVPALVVEQAMLRAASELRRQRQGQAPRSERTLIALPAFRMGAGGRWDQELESARAQLRKARGVLDREELADTDVVFVTYTQQIYQTYLESRRREFGEPPCEQPELERALRSGECVLFIGAGLSKGSGLPDWSELMKKLAADLNIDLTVEQLDYLDVAQWYAEDKRFGPAQLAEMIRTVLGDPECLAHPTLAHYLLVSLPVRFVITTNYDHLLEQTLTALRRYPMPIVKQEDVPRTGQREGIYVVKLHGDVGDAEHLVLTRDAYDTFFQGRPAMALLLESLLLNETFFFVGYSLSDPNFRQIFARISGMLRDALRPAFATILYPDRGTGKYLKRQWGQKGLNLVLFEANATPPEHQLLCFLDRLADRVTMQTSHFFLARDVEIKGLSEPLRALRQDVLIEQMAERVQQACTSEICSSAEDTRQLAQMLAFLTFQGWRPPKTSPERLADLWMALANRCKDNPAERQRMLMIALRNTERMEHAERIQEQLRELETNLQDTERPPAILPDNEEKPGMGLL
jgi:O-acetyl-ADP-ribose deacetylase (regulator of RNase III)